MTSSFGYLHFRFQTNLHRKRSDLITMMQSVYHSGNFGTKIQMAIFCNYGGEIIEQAAKYENVV